MSVQVDLTQHEFFDSAQAGLLRQIVAMRNGMKHRNNPDPFEAFGHHILGAWGEYAVSKFLRVFWSIGESLGGFKKTDITGLKFPIEVKTTFYNPSDLILYGDEPNNVICILVWVSRDLDVCKIKGWAWSQDIKRQPLKSYGNGRPAVPALSEKELKPANDLFYLLGLPEKK